MSRGRAQFDEYSNSMRVVADSLLSAGEARARFARRLELKLNGEVAQLGAHAACARLKSLLEPFRVDGGCAVRLHYRSADAVGPLDFGDGWRVRLDDALFDGLRDWLPAEAVSVTYS